MKIDLTKYENIDMCDNDVLDDSMKSLFEKSVQFFEKQYGILEEIENSETKACDEGGVYGKKFKVKDTDKTLWMMMDLGRINDKEQPGLAVNWFDIDMEDKTKEFHLNLDTEKWNEYPLSGY